VVVAGGGADVPPEDESLPDPPPPLAGFPPPPQPTKELKNRTNPKQSEPRKSLRTLLPARNVNEITNAANRRSWMVNGDWGYESVEVAGVVTDNVILTGEPSRLTLFVLGVQVLPAGVPLQLSATTPVKPEIGVAARL